MRWKKFADKLIEHCSEGKTIESFCGKIDISRQTFYRWKRESKKFTELVEIAQAKSLLYWEEQLQKAVHDKNMNGNIIKFVLASRFREIYSEKRELEQTDIPEIRIVDH